MINLITGVPGSGKTLFTLTEVQKLAVSKDSQSIGRKVFYNGIPDLTLPWEQLEQPTRWFDLPEGSIIVIDEAQTTFRPRGSGAAVPDYVSQLETHRHKGFDLFIITQHPMLIDGNVRKLVGRHVHVKRFLGFPKSTLHEFQQTRDNCDKSLKGSIESQFFFPKKSYEWYKSATIHTVKKRIPMRIVLMLILPIVAVAGIYYALESISKFGDAGIAATQPNSILSNDLQQPQSPNQIEQSQKPDLELLTYAQAHTPEIQGLPFTAPIYQEIIKPVEAPYPAACYHSKSKGCKCFTQQATPITMDEQQCLQVVNHGFFKDWQSDTKQAKTEKSEPARGLLRGEQPLDGGFAVPPNSVGLSSRNSPSNSATF